ncbi:MAG: DUF167 domain-containing protein [Deltaproteobacteria bacterium]|nr:DUF167 domain-containing protein [Deltaproteobacteria bacterium]
MTGKDYPFISQCSSGLRLHLWVKPNAKRNEFAGIHGGKLKLSIAAPAAENRANTALEKFLAQSFSLPKSRVVVERGHTSREKVVLLSEVTLQEIAAHLEKLLANDYT